MGHVAVGEVTVIVGRFQQCYIPWGAGGREEGSARVLATF